VSSLGTLRAIVEKSVKDPRFRENLLSDPRSAIEQEFGAGLPEEIRIHVHENTPNEVHLVLPAPVDLSEQRRLNEEELERIAAGKPVAPRFATMPCTDTHCFAWDEPPGRPPQDF
jgi:hypothetical protein